MNVTSTPFFGRTKARESKIEIMKNLLITILIFLIGIIIGYSVTNFQEDSPSGVAAERSNPSGVGSDQDSHDEENNKGMDAEREPRPPRSVMLYNQALPKAASFWGQVDLTLMRKRDEEFSQLMEGENFSTIWKEITASLPQGVTQVVEHLYNSYDYARFFLLPPGTDQHASTLVLAVQPSEEETDSSLSAFDEFLTSSFPEAAATETDADGQLIRTISTPLGSFSIITEEGITWICTQAEALRTLWTSEPPNAVLENPPDYPQMLLAHPDSIISLFFNAAHTGPAAVAPPGRFPVWLSQQGIRHVAIFYQWEQNQTRMTVLAPTEAIPNWAHHWKPIEQYPFNQSDPMGLAEIAFRWLPGDSVVSVTDAVHPEASRRDRRTDRRERKQTAWQHTEGFNPSTGVVPVEQTPFPASVNNMPARLVQRFAFPNRIIGVNFYGFYNGVPTLAILFPDLKQGESLFQKFERLKGIDSSSIEIAKIPGSLYRLENSFLNQLTGLEKLLLIERDARSYMFDQVDSARYYFGEMDALNQNSIREQSIRENLKHLREPAQIMAVLTSDYFRFILNSELEQLPPEVPFRDQLVDLVDELIPFAQPMVITAGVDEEEWFMETSSPDKVSHLIDTSILGLIGYRILGM